MQRTNRHIFTSVGHNRFTIANETRFRVQLGDLDFDLVTQLPQLTGKVPAAITRSCHRPNAVVKQTLVLRPTAQAHEALGEGKKVAAKLIQRVVCVAKHQDVQALVDGHRVCCVYISCMHISELCICVRICAYTNMRVKTKTKKLIHM